jgi:hypothetical protein
MSIEAQLSEILDPQAMGFGAEITYCETFLEE